MNELESRALAFATNAHAGQVRKYSGEPYITHPIAVAEIVRRVTDDPEMIAAALLHDVVEDTPFTIDKIAFQFGERVALLVSDLTDVSRPADGNRATRKRIDREHTAKAHPDAKTVKLADLIHNTDDITRNDPGFAKVYLAEKHLLLPFLIEGSGILFVKASTQLQYFASAKSP